METPEGYRRVMALGETGAGKSRILQLVADEYARRGGEVWSLDMRALQPKPMRGFLIRPPEDMEDWQADGPFFDFVNAWCARAYEVAKARGWGLLLQIDETDLAIRAGKIPPALVRVVMQGRAHGVSYAFAVRRPVEVPPALRSMVEDMFVFRLTELRDQEFMRQKHVVGLERLKRGEFWHVRAGETPHFHSNAFTACTTTGE